MSTCLPCLRQVLHTTKFLGHVGADGPLRLAACGAQITPQITMIQHLSLSLRYVVPLVGLAM